MDGENRDGMLSDEQTDIARRIASNLRQGRTGNRRKDLEVQTEPGDNTAAMLPYLKLYSLPPIDRHDAEQVQQRIVDYFQLCADADLKPSVAGLALALKLHRTELWKLANGVENYDRLYSEAVRNSVKGAYQLMNAMMEHYMQNGKINPVSGIFLMKNGFGYRDQAEVVVTPRQDADSYSADDIRARYAITPADAAGPDDGTR